VHRHELGVAHGVTEEHAPGERVCLDVGKPGIEEVVDPLLQRFLAGCELLLPDLPQFGEDQLAGEVAPVVRDLERGERAACRSLRAVRTIPSRSRAAASVREVSLAIGAIA